MNILLIYPPDRINFKAVCPPLGLAHIASVLIKEGHDVSIIEVNADRYSDNQLLRIIRNYKPKPDIIGIGGIVSTYKYVKWLTNEIKTIYSGIPVVIGGSVGSSIPELILKHTPADIIVDKEGENTMLQIVTNLDGGNMDLSGVPGIFYRCGDGILHSGHRERIRNLDTLPLPAYHLLPMEIYIENVSQESFYRDVLSVSSENRHMVLIASRGCTDHCTFCFRQFPKVAMNSAEYVYNHINYLHSQYGINRLTFMDELFISSKQRTWELIDVLKKLKWEIDLCYRIASARVDTINIELLNALKASGCVDIVYGLESGSQRMLDIMKKRTTVEQNRKASMLTHKSGLHTTPQFVVGMPGETVETLKETFRFVDSIDFWDNIGFHFANPYPGTEIYYNARKQGLIKDEDEFISGISGTDNYPIQLADVPFKTMQRMIRFFHLRRSFRNDINRYGYIGGVLKFASGILKKAVRKGLAWKGGRT